jgi:hypothetical protein
LVATTVWAFIIIVVVLAWAELQKIDGDDDHE